MKLSIILLLLHLFHGAVVGTFVFWGGGKKEGASDSDDLGTTALPFSARDSFNAAGLEKANPNWNKISGKPEVFKCRAMSTGAELTFAHEWTHFSATTNCNLILLEGQYTEKEWSDISHQAYRIQNHIEHIPDSDAKIHDVNHKIPVLRVLFQRYLAPRMEYLKKEEPAEWAAVKRNLQSVGCPLFKDEDLPDVMNPTWWSDVGLTAGRIFKSESSAFDRPTEPTLTDITRETLLPVAEGILTNDFYRWYKGTKGVSCIPMIIKINAADDEKNIEFVTARNGRLAVQAMFLKYCGASLNANKNNDFGYCSGKVEQITDFANEKKAIYHSHPGFTYNVIGGGISLGTKPVLEASQLSWFNRLLIQIARAFGVRTYEKDDVLASHDGSGSKSVKNLEQIFTDRSANVGRCTWNVEHDTNYGDTAEDSEHLTRLPLDYDKKGENLNKDENCLGGDQFRLRDYHKFPKKSEYVEIDEYKFEGKKQISVLEDNRNGAGAGAGTVEGTDAGVRSPSVPLLRVNGARRLLGVGTSGSSGKYGTNTLEDIGSWWFENPFTESQPPQMKSMYGQIIGVDSLGIKKKQMNKDGVESITSKAADELTVLGAPPFGWKREKCILCWSGPVFIQNLIRRCEKDTGDVVYAADIDNMELWKHHKMSKLYHNMFSNNEKALWYGKDENKKPYITEAQKKAFYKLDLINKP
jgi:hypothetical protein